MAELLRVHELTKSYPVRGGVAGAGGGGGAAGRFGRTRNRAPSGPVVATPAVSEVSFDVDQGEILAIVGESGCGKTTTAKMLVGLIAPDTGTVSVDGRVLPARRGRADRRLIQLVTQNPWSALNRRRTLGHSLQLPLRVHEPALGKRERRARVEQMVTRVGLTPAYLDGYPREVSGGELARFVLARSLLATPKVLVLDEPTASLDASVKATVAQLVLDLAAELGLAVVLITHELAVARRVADRVAVMYRGRFVDTGPVEDVFTRPSHPYARQLLANA